MQHLYADEKYRDVFFKLDSGKVYGAHRVVLGTSDVEWFRTILETPFKERTDSVIEVRDVSDWAFEIALRRCYKLDTKVNPLDIESHFIASTMFLCDDIFENISPEYESAPEYMRCCLKYNKPLPVGRVTLWHIVYLLEIDEITAEEAVRMFRFVIKKSLRTKLEEYHADYFKNLAERAAAREAVLREWMDLISKLPDAKRNSSRFISVTDWLFKTILLEGLLGCLAYDAKAGSPLVIYMLEKQFISQKEVDQLPREDSTFLPGFPVRVGWGVMIEDPQPDLKPVYLADFGTSNEHTDGDLTYYDYMFVEPEGQDVSEWECCVYYEPI